MSSYKSCWNHVWTQKTLRSFDSVVAVSFSFSIFQAVAFLLGQIRWKIQMHSLRKKGSKTKLSFNEFIYNSVLCNSELQMEICISTDDGGAFAATAVAVLTTTTTTTMTMATLFVGVWSVLETGILVHCVWVWVCVCLWPWLNLNRALILMLDSNLPRNYTTAPERTSAKAYSRSDKTSCKQFTLSPYRNLRVYIACEQINIYGQRVTSDSCSTTNRLDLKRACVCGWEIMVSRKCL